MNILRFSDLCAQGKAQGQRVFIRADLNVPQDDAGRITEDTRIRASIPCIQMALDAGAAVMVTSHLGRPTEGAQIGKTKNVHGVGASCRGTWIRAVILGGCQPCLRTGRPAGCVYQPQPMCSGKYTAMPTTMVPKISRRQK